MAGLEAEIDRVATESRFSGVVRVDVGSQGPWVRAYGMSHRALALPNTIETRFATASGTKGVTALTVMSLVDRGVLGLDTRARSLLGRDLPLVDDTVTVEQLLGHRSGIGDYLDEDLPGDVDDYVLTVPPHLLATTEAYLAVLDGHPTKFAPGQRFSYSNSGYVLLALLAERATAASFYDLVDELVCRPAGLVDTAFLRADELPDRTALGYLAAEGPRTNVFHLPVRGSGDGGIYSTAADVHRLWQAFFAGAIVPPGRVATMVAPRSTVGSMERRYGLGFWLHVSTDAVMLEGSDAGVSFRTVHQPSRAVTSTVLSNTSQGAWAVAARLEDLLEV